MKNPKKLLRKEKVFLVNQGLNPGEYLLERKDTDSYTFYHVPTKKLITIRR